MLQWFDERRDRYWWLVCCAIALPMARGAHAVPTVSPQVAVMLAPNLSFNEAGVRFIVCTPGKPGNQRFAPQTLCLHTLLAVQPLTARVGG